MAGASASPVGDAGEPSAKLLQLPGSHRFRAYEDISAIFRDLLGVSDISMIT